MLPRIGWRQRALAWSALPVGSALLLAVACAPAPTPLAAYTALPLAAAGAQPAAAHEGMPMAVHAMMPMAAPAVMGMDGTSAMPAVMGMDGASTAHAAMVMDGAASAPARATAMDAPPAETMADAPAIDIQAFQFSAPALTVPVGTTVTWTNHDVEPHTVTSRDRAFGSRGLETNDTFAFRFDTPGTYAYYCALHPFMTGQIVVQ